MTEQHTNDNYEQLDELGDELRKIVERNNLAPNSLAEATEYIRYKHD